MGHLPPSCTLSSERARLTDPWGWAPFPRFFVQSGRDQPSLRSGPPDTLQSVSVFFDAHVCRPPSTASLIGREMDFECRCGRRWRLEHFFGKDGSILGPSWVLL
jgi:hypothetical protein